MKECRSFPDWNCPTRRNWSFFFWLTTRKIQRFFARIISRECCFVFALTLCRPLLYSMKGGKVPSLFSLLLRTLRSQPGILESNLAHKPVVEEGGTLTRAIAYRSILFRLDRCSLSSTFQPLALALRLFASTT